MTYIAILDRVGRSCGACSGRVGVFGQRLLNVTSAGL